MNTLDGYNQPLSTQEDVELTHVARGTPCGEYLRRFWHPIALTEELAGVPLPLRVLGEDLVLFRDKRGELGLLFRHCAHRGTSLEFGIVSERGLRCCYHGWLYDVDGRILETPAQPDNPVRRNACQGAYPTLEYSGLIFAYLGPQDERPTFPIYDSWSATSDTELVPFKLSYACNWLQIHENTADPMHIPFLHGRVSGVQFTPGFSELPLLSFANTPLGIVVNSTRYAEGRLWMRAADVIFPNVAQYPPAFETGEEERLLLGAWATRWVVPSDTTRSWVIGFRHFNTRLDPHGQGNREEIGLEKVDFSGQTPAAPEDRQRSPGDYEAMIGQGPIAIHANEHLLSSDRGVARLRKLLRQQVSSLQAGNTPELPRVYSEQPVPTYTYEALAPAPLPKDPASFQRIGDQTLDLLIESATETSSSRGEWLQRKIGELIRCL